MPFRNLERCARGIAQGRERFPVVRVLPQPFRQRPVVRQPGALRPPEQPPVLRRHHAQRDPVCDHGASPRPAVSPAWGSARRAGASSTGERRRPGEAPDRRRGQRQRPAAEQAHVGVEAVVVGQRSSTGTPSAACASTTPPRPASARRQDEDRPPPATAIQSAVNRPTWNAGRSAHAPCASAKAWPPVAGQRLQPADRPADDGPQDRGRRERGQCAQRHRHGGPRPAPPPVTCRPDRRHRDQQHGDQRLRERMDGDGIRPDDRRLDGQHQQPRDAQREEDGRSRHQHRRPTTPTHRRRERRRHVERDSAA